MEVLDVLESIGVEVTSVGTKEAMAFCPVHEARVGFPNTKTPAFSINLSTGAWICYSCNAAGGIAMLVEEVTGEAQPDLARTVRHEANKRKATELARDPAQPPPEPEVVADEYTYGNFAKVPSKLLAFKHLDPAVAERYGLRWDRKGKLWIIPVRDHEGKLLGWQERNKGYFSNVPKGMEKSHCLFGWEQAIGSHFCYVVESPLDAVRLASVGAENPLSTYGAWISDEQIDLLRCFQFVVIALDDDMTGHNAGEVVARRLGKGKVRWFPYADGYKDPGDYESDELLALRVKQARCNVRR